MKRMSNNSWCLFTLLATKIFLCVDKEAMLVIPTTLLLMTVFTWFLFADIWICLQWWFSVSPALPPSRHVSQCQQQCLWHLSFAHFLRPTSRLCQPSTGAWLYHYPRAHIGGRAIHQHWKIQGYSGSHSQHSQGASKIQMLQLAAVTFSS